MKILITDQMGDDSQKQFRKITQRRPLLSSSFTFAKHLMYQSCFAAF